MAYEPTADATTRGSCARSPTRSASGSSTSSNAAGPIAGRRRRAEALGIPANQASFHLRQLAKYGLVGRAPEAARDRRDRVWRVVSERGIRLDLTEIGQGARRAGRGRRSSSENKAAWAHAVVDEVFSFKQRRGRFSAIVDQAP